MALAKVDEAPDEVLYRRTVMKAFLRLPRWWRCDLARFSMLLDDRWQTGYWADSIVPAGICDVCGRRAAIRVYGGEEAAEDTEVSVDDGDPGHSVLDDREVRTCGCHLRGEIWTEADLTRAMDEARAASVCGSALVGPPDACLRSSQPVRSANDLP